MDNEVSHHGHINETNDLKIQKAEIFIINTNINRASMNYTVGKEKLKQAISHSSK